MLAKKGVAKVGTRLITYQEGKSWKIHEDHNLQETNTERVLSEAKKNQEMQDVLGTTCKCQRIFPIVEKLCFQETVREKIGLSKCFI